MKLERDFIALVEADPIAERRNGGKSGEGMTLRKVLDRPLKVTPDLLPLVRREFRRITYSGTMSASRQIKRPSHEMAIALFLLDLAGHSRSTTLMPSTLTALGSA